MIRVCLPSQSAPEKHNQKSHIPLRTSYVPQRCVRHQLIIIKYCYFDHRINLSNANNLLTPTSARYISNVKQICQQLWFNHLCKDRGLIPDGRNDQYEQGHFGLWQQTRTGEVRLVSIWRQHTNQISQRKFIHEAFDWQISHITVKRISAQHGIKQHSMLSC